MTNIVERRRAAYNVSDIVMLIFGLVWSVAAAFAETELAKHAYYIIANIWIVGSILRA